MYKKNVPCLDRDAGPLFTMDGCNAGSRGNISKLEIQLDTYVVHSFLRSSVIYLLVFNLHVMVVSLMEKN